MCPVLDITQKDAQAKTCSLWGLRMLGEAIPFRESVSALFGSAKPLVAAELELSEIGHFARRVSFAAKATIFTESDAAIAVYKLTHGTACLYKMMADGRRQIVGFALPGDFLGSPFSDQYPCSVDAISEIRACQFPRGSFLTFLRTHPTNLYLMLEATLQETNAAREHMLMLGRGTAEEKFVEFIINWRARVGRRGALANLVPLPMSRRDVADFLGLTIETVSRVVTKLERENVIRVVPEGLQLLGSTERPLLFERGYKIA
jgi:CRP/FNR family transcriptional regulator